MYPMILVTLEATPTDRVIIDHIKALAKTLGSRVTLLHVATGVPAQIHKDDAAGQEIDEDERYLDSIGAEFAEVGVEAVSHLAYGSPAREIISWVRGHPCDLIAMSTHGHHWFGDLVLGVTASRVQHNVSVPVLLIRAR